MDTKLEDLHRCTLLRAVGPAAMARVGRAVEIADVPGGTVLERAGATPACWWIVLRGTVCLDGGEGASVVGAGESWGLADALGRRPASATATAFDDVRVAAVDRRRLAPLLLDVPQLAVDLLRR